MNKLFLSSVLIFSIIGLNAQWIAQSSGVQANLTGIHIVDSLRGWTCGTYNNSYILHTNDGGNFWETQFNDDVPGLYDLYFIDDSIGWAVGGNHPPIVAESVVLHTEDGGLSWEREYEEAMDIFHGVYFTTPEIGWIAGGVLHHTSDGGSSWSTVNLGDGFGHYDVFFTDQNNGWTVGHYGGTVYGSIHHTTDGGDTWVEQTSGTDYDLHDVYFINDSVGWAVGVAQTILYTDNGGALWETQYSSTYQEGNFFNVYFADDLTGWVVGSDGQIWHTDNGGLYWEMQLSEVESGLGGVYFNDSNTGWVCGANGVILHTDNGGTVGIDEVSKPESGHLQVNIYPNPFTSSTSISYDLPQSSTVQITIFNHFGQQVDFIQQNQSQGKQQIIWDASGLPAGVYYFRLEADEQVATGKLLLVN